MHIFFIKLLFSAPMNTATLESIVAILIAKVNIKKKENPI